MSESQALACERNQDCLPFARHQLQLRQLALNYVRWEPLNAEERDLIQAGDEQSFHCIESATTTHIGSCVVQHVLVHEVEELQRQSDRVARRLVVVLAHRRVNREPTPNPHQGQRKYESVQESAHERGQQPTCLLATVRWKA